MWNVRTKGCVFRRSVENSRSEMKTASLLILIVGCIGLCNGHAIFWEPPSRASLGKHNLNFCNVPVNDDHMSLYCGGIVVSSSYFPTKYMTYISMLQKYLSFFCANFEGPTSRIQWQMRHLRRPLWSGLSATSISGPFCNWHNWAKLLHSRTSNGFSTFSAGGA